MEMGYKATVSLSEKSALLKPDYIEMDVQETKMASSSCLHDATLKDPAGVDKHPQD